MTHNSLDARGHLNNSLICNTLYNEFLLELEKLLTTLHNLKQE